MNIYPIRLIPIYKNYFWGGSRIIEKYMRNVANNQCAESWEICDRKDIQSIVENGAYKGSSLSKLLFEWQDKLIGKEQIFKQFPLLIKIIDAKKKLSIQVHPDKSSANNFSVEPKNEAWYVLEANHSQILAGFKYGVDEKIFKEAVISKRLPEILRKINIQLGDVINIPGGRVHAICEGSLILEVQQNSDTTYRIYDWDRTDDEGNFRQLHLLQALQVINFDDVDDPCVFSRLIYESQDYSYIRLLKTPFFLMEKVIIYKQWTYDSDQTSFQIYFCLCGKGKIIADGKQEQITTGQTYLIPAFAKEVKIINENKLLEVLKITLS